MSTQGNEGLGPSLCYADDYRVFQIDDGEIHYVVDMLPEEAIKSHGVDGLDYKTVESYLDEMGPIECEVVPASQQITVRDDDGGSQTKAARDWAITHRGVFCSTCW
jgi:hypothetical protein